MRRWLAGIRGLVLMTALASSLGTLCSCGSVIRYTDALMDARSGRTLATRAPATFGSVVGLIAGIPIDVAALPVTYAVYSAQEKASRDAISIFMFPSFVLWRVGALVGAPFDFIEWVVWRGWCDADALSPEERERRERELDQLDFSDYPVTPIYPTLWGK